MARISVDSSYLRNLPAGVPMPYRTWIDYRFPVAQPATIQSATTRFATALVAFWFLAASPVGARETAELQSFVAEHCFDCHQGAGSEANLDLSTLEMDLDEPQVFAKWVKVFDRVADGEMPPPDSAELPSEARDKFVHGTEDWLASHELQMQRAEGRTRGKRLTNMQLERTLQDLLDIDIPLAREMPEEPKTGEFTTLAELQSISHFQLEQHLRVVDLALDEAFRRALSDDDGWHREMSAEDISRTRDRTREPEFIDGCAVVWSSNLIFYGRLPATTAKESGWYRFRFSVSSLKQPADRSVWCTVRTGPCVSSAPLLDWVGAFEATPETRDFSFDAWLPKGHMLEIRPGDQTLKMAKFAGGQSSNGEGGAQDVPGIAIERLSMERFHPGGNDAQVRASLFGDLSLQPIADAAREPKDQARESARTERNSRRKERQQPAPAAYHVVTENPLEDGRRLIRDFAARAFRRPAEDQDVAKFFSIFEDALGDSNDFVAALRAGYRAVLCSARFLYFQEPSGKLDGFAIASRLSYLLTNSLPDEELIQAATDGKLYDASELRRQVDRLLQTPRGEKFVEDFSAQWLELSEIDFTEPDRKLHPDFDIVVQYSMLGETHRFLKKMLSENQCISRFVDCDTTFVNSRLARFYDLPTEPELDNTGTPREHASEPNPSDRMWEVKLRPEDHRGGLLAQGAILKVTANGTNTSPVIRGVWVSERILGQPIPPPPENVPAIEPDIRGAKTIREQLELHRSNSECASCHSKIDPPGYALENFDAAGKWREYYPKVQKGGQKQGLKVDPSYVTARGEPFKDINDFRQIKAADPQPLARNFAEQLIAYGTGAKVSFADRRAVEQIVDKASHENYGVRSILYAVVTSDLFATK